MFNFTNPKYEGFDKFSVTDPQYKLKLLIDKYSKTSTNGDRTNHYLHYDLIYCDSLHFSLIEDYDTEYFAGKKYLELILHPILPQRIYQEVIEYLTEQKIIPEDLTLIL
jgi:hypothetical protein